MACDTCACAHEREWPMISFGIKGRPKGRAPTEQSEQSIETKKKGEFYGQCVAMVGRKATGLPQFS